MSRTGSSGNGGATDITALTGDVTAAGSGSVVATLATVNSNVGTFGDASHVAQVTEDAKGRTTAVSNVAIQIAESQVTNLVSDLAGKEPTVTKGNLTDAGTDGIVVTGGTAAVIGAGTSIAQHVADASHNGYLNSGDWSTFNGKQPAGDYVTALTSDVSASGPGSAAATVNSVGGSSAANVHSAELLANAATDANTASAIIKRDASGNFSAGQVTATNVVDSGLTALTALAADSGKKVVSVPANTALTHFLLSQYNSLAPSMAINGCSGGVALLPNAKYINAFGSNINTGNNDLYTVPANRRAMLLAFTMYNNSAGTITSFWAVKIGATYFRLSNSTGVGVGTTFGANINCYIYEPGEIVAVNTTTTNGLNVWLQLVEFDNTAAIKTSKLVSFINGDNTLYTCPAGKTAGVVNNVTQINNSLGGLYINQVSGGNISYKVNVVPSGGSVANTNTLRTTTTVTAQNLTTFACNVGLAAGDFISVNSNSTNGSQIVWVNVVEL